MATMTLHEGGHFMAAVIFHAKEAALHHNYASYNTEELSLSAQLLTVAAGPLFSLLLGIVYNFICSRYSKEIYYFFSCSI